MFVLLTPTRKHALETTNRKQLQKQASWFWPTLLLPTFMPFYLSKPTKTCGNFFFSSFSFWLTVSSTSSCFVFVFELSQFVNALRSSRVLIFHFFSLQNFSLFVCDTFWLSFSCQNSMFCFCRTSLSFPFSRA